MEASGRDLEDTRLFLAVVRMGSFTRVAAAHDVPKSTVSRAIARLEKALGTQLLYRTTRSLRPTGPGAEYVARCEEALRTIEEAQDAVRAGASEVEGLLRLTAPEDLGSILVDQAVRELLRVFPRLRLETRYTDEVVDLVKEGFDLAVRIGRLPSSGFRARKIGEIRSVLVASPAYLARNGTPRKPSDLSTHAALVFTPGFEKGTWNLVDERAGRRETVAANTLLASNHARSLLEFARAGSGISFLPDFVCAQALESGDLTRVLPAWYSRRLPVYVVTPAQRSEAVRLTKVMTLLVGKLRPLVGGYDLP